MNIRAKLTFRYVLVTGLIMLISCVLIYLLSADYRQTDFYERLLNKANNTAKLLIEVEEVDVSLLRRIEQDNPVSLPKEKITIYNYKDSVLFTTDESHAITADKNLLDKVRLEDIVKYKQGNYEVLGFLFKGHYDRFVVIAAAEDIYGHKRLKNLLFILSFVFGVSLLISFISGWIYAGKALQPISKVVKQVDEISISSLNMRVDEGNGTDEIAKLAHTFNNMLERLEIAFTNQRHFIANASHELRTPLTAITGQLEVTLLNRRTEAEYVEVLNSVLEDIKNLNLLSNRLLILAQTSAEERQKQMSLIRIDELLWQAKEELQKHHPAFVVQMDLDENLDDEMLTIKGDIQLIKTAFSNIIENACKYSSDHCVQIFLKGLNGELNIQFSDKGLGIPKDDLIHIFEPFYRGNNVTSIKGHGIGLSMVKGIIKLHKGAIKIDSEQGVGTTVAISLPLVQRVNKVTT